METKKDHIFAGLKSGIITSLIISAIAIIFLKQTLFPPLLVDQGMGMNDMANGLITYMIIATLIVAITIGLITGSVIAIISAFLIEKKQFSLRKSTIWSALAIECAYLIYRLPTTIVALNAVESQSNLSTYIITEVTIFSIFITTAGYIYYRICEKKQ